MAAKLRATSDRRHIVGGWILVSVLATLGLGGLSHRAEASATPAPAAAVR